MWCAVGEGERAKWRKEGKEERRRKRKSGEGERESGKCAPYKNEYCTKEVD